MSNFDRDLPHSVEWQDMDRPVNFWTGKFSPHR